MKRETDLTRRILQSQNGQRIVDFVAPIYNEGEIALWLFESIGQILDDISDNIDSLRRQVTPDTATWTLPYWENEYNITPEAYWNEEERRAGIIAKIKYVAPVNPAKLEEFASSVMSAPCEIIENVGKNTFHLVIHGWSDNFPRLKATIDSAKPAHLIWSVHAEIPPIIFIEQPGSMFLKRLRFKTFVNYWRYHAFNGDKKFDGSISFSSRRIGFNMIETHIKVNANMPHRFYPAQLKIHSIPFSTEEKVLLIIECERIVFDNMGDFVRLDGDKKLDGSWLLWQRARCPIYKDFQITATLREKKKIYSVATVIRAVRHTPNLFQRGKLEADVFTLDFVKEIIENQINFSCKEKENFASVLQKISFFNFSARNGEMIRLAGNIFGKWREKKTFLPREIFASIPFSEPAGSGNAALSASVFEISKLSENIVFDQNWRVEADEASLYSTSAIFETAAKFSKKESAQEVKNVRFASYSVVNHNTFGENADITTIPPSRADGTYCFDGTLRFDGKSTPQTEKI